MQLVSDLPVISLAIQLMLLLLGSQDIPSGVYSQLPFVPSSPSISPGSNNSTAATTTPRNAQSHLITSNNSTSKQ
jgi:hypothetical protein